MTSGDPTQRDALLRLGTSTADALAQVLESFAPGEVTRGEVTVLDSDTSPFAALEPGSVTATVSYVDGIAGANVFVASRHTARALAARMGVPEDPDAGADAELSELELSAVSEATNQMMAAAANAISMVVGQEIAISPPQMRVIADAGDADESLGTAPHVTSTSFSISDETCRLIQLIPNAFVVRVTQAMGELVREPAGGGLLSPAAGIDHSHGLSEALSGVSLRVWAELGRTELPLGEAVQLPLGSIVELDRATEAPVDLFVNGLRFAHGRLMVSGEGHWLFHLDELASGQTVSPVAAAPTS